MKPELRDFTDMSNFQRGNLKFNAQDYISPLHQSPEDMDEKQKFAAKELQKRTDVQFIRYFFFIEPKL